MTLAAVLLLLIHHCSAMRTGYVDTLCVNTSTDIRSPADCKRDTGGTCNKDPCESKRGAVCEFTNYQFRCICPLGSCSDANGECKQITTEHDDSAGSGAATSDTQPQVAGSGAATSDTEPQETSDQPTDFTGTYILAAVEGNPDATAKQLGVGAFQRKMAAAASWGAKSVKVVVNQRCNTIVVDSSTMFGQSRAKFTVGNGTFHLTNSKGTPYDLTPRWVDHPDGRRVESEVQQGGISFKQLRYRRGNQMIVACLIGGEESREVYEPSGEVRHKPMVECTISSAAPHTNTSNTLPEQSITAVSEGAEADAFEPEVAHSQGGGWLDRLGGAAVGATVVLIAVAIARACSSARAT